MAELCCHTLLLETAQEALDDAVLFGRIESDELLAQEVIEAGGTKAPALEDQAIVAANHRVWNHRVQRTKARHEVCRKSRVRESYKGARKGGIADEVLDQLLEGRDPATVFESGVWSMS